MNENTTYSYLGLRHQSRVDWFVILLWATGKDLSLLNASILLVQSVSISTSLLVPLSVV